MMHRCPLPRAWPFIDQVPPCRIVAGWALMVALLAADPSGDRSEELHACFGVLIDMVSGGMPLIPSG